MESILRFELFGRLHRKLLCGQNKTKILFYRISSKTAPIFKPKSPNFPPNWGYWSKNGGGQMLYSCYFDLKVTF